MYPPDQEPVQDNRSQYVDNQGLDQQTAQHPEPEGKELGAFTYDVKARFVPKAAEASLILVRWLFRRQCSVIAPTTLLL